MDEENSMQSNDNKTPLPNIDTDSLRSLVASWNANPPFPGPITLHFEAERELQYELWAHVQMQAHLIQLAKPGAVILQSTRIVFASDYRASLAAEQDDWHPELVPTDNGEHAGAAMAVCKKDETVIVVHPAIVAMLMSEDDPPAVDEAQHLLRHEMCHSIDYESKRSIPGFATRDGDGLCQNDLDRALLPMVVSLWDEFFANRYAYVDGSSSPTNDFDRLCELLPMSFEDVMQAVIQYSRDRDLNALHGRATAVCKAVASFMGYAAGTAAARTLDFEAHPSAFKEALARYHISEAYDLALKSLQNLDAARRWPSVSRQRLLFPVAIALLASFGLNYSPQSSGFYVEIAGNLMRRAHLLALTGSGSTLG